jgi:hypothetical protein
MPSEGAPGTHVPVLKIMTQNSGPCQSLASSSCNHFHAEASILVRPLQGHTPGSSRGSAEAASFLLQPVENKRPAVTMTNGQLISFGSIEIINTT